MSKLLVGETPVTRAFYGNTEARKIFMGEDRLCPGPESILYLHLASGGEISLDLGTTLSNDYGYIDHVVVQWGDGVQEAVAISWMVITQKHNYAAPGDYKIRIRGNGSLYSLGSSNDSVLGVKDTKQDTTPQLLKVRIGDGVRYLGCSFWGCTSLTILTVPATVYRMAGKVMGGCTSLIAAEIGAKKITGKPFTSCPSLRMIWIRESTDYIGADCLGDIAPSGTLTVYCEADSKPDGWDAGWNPDGYTVVWGQKARPW